MSLMAQSTESYNDDPLLKVLSTLKNESDAGISSQGATVSGNATPAQRKLAEQAKALANGSSPPTPQSPPQTMQYAGMTAAALRQKAPEAASALLEKSPLESPAVTPQPQVAPAPRRMEAPQQGVQSAPKVRPAEELVPETQPSKPPVAPVTPAAKAVPVEPTVAEQKPAPEALVPPQAPISGIPAPRPEGVSTRSAAEDARQDTASASVLSSHPAPAPAAPVEEPPAVAISEIELPELDEAVPVASSPEPSAAPLPVAHPVSKISIDTPIPQLEIHDDEFDTVLDDDIGEAIARGPREMPEIAAPHEDEYSSAEVAPGDALPLVGGGQVRAIKAGNRKGGSSTLKTVAYVLAAQAVLIMFGLGVLWASSDARSSFRKFAHRVLGTSAIVAAGEPHWMPDLTPTTLEGGGGNNPAFEELGMMKGKITELERQLSVTPAEAWKELRLLSQRNQLTSYADESITEGSRKAYMELRNIAETSKDAALRHAAEAELLRIRFFYASGSRLGSYKLPTATLYPDGGSKKDEDLSSDELTSLLLDKTKDWEIRSRAAYLLGDRRGYEVARSLVEAVRTDECLDVIEQAMYSFEEMTAYRSPGAFEIQNLLDWWNDNSVKLKSSLN